MATDSVFSFYQATYRTDACNEPQDMSYRRTTVLRIPFGVANVRPEASLKRIPTVGLGLSLLGQKVLTQSKKALLDHTKHANETIPCQTFTLTSKYRHPDPNSTKQLEIDHLLMDVKSALKSGGNFYKMEDANAMGQSYLIKDADDSPVAIFKPQDEEPLGPNNSKAAYRQSLGEAGQKPGVPVGGGAIREAAAYLLDHDGAANVPTTTVIEVKHPYFDGPRVCPANRGQVKRGALQRFVSNEGSVEDFGPFCFDEGDVRRIAMLDIRLQNADRHSGNFLRKPEASSNGSHHNSPRFRLVPIDHGCSLPETCTYLYLEWRDWPAAHRQFTSQELEAIEKLDPLADARMLRAVLPDLSESAIRGMVVATVLLKAGARCGRTLAEIAEFMERKVNSDGSEGLSSFEEAIAKQRIAVSKAAESREGSIRADKVTEHDAGAKSLAALGFNVIFQLMITTETPSEQNFKQFIDVAVKMLDTSTAGVQEPRGMPIPGGAPPPAGSYASGSLDHRTIIGTEDGRSSYVGSPMDTGLSSFAAMFVVDLGSQEQFSEQGLQRSQQEADDQPAVKKACSGCEICCGRIGLKIGRLPLSIQANNSLYQEMMRGTANGTGAPAAGHSMRSRFPALEGSLSATLSFPLGMETGPASQAGLPPRGSTATDEARAILPAVSNDELEEYVSKWETKVKLPGQEYEEVVYDVVGGMAKEEWDLYEEHLGKLFDGALGNPKDAPEPAQFSQSLSATPVAQVA